MAPAAPLPLVDRLLQLLQHFGLDRAHVVAAVPGDWRGLVTAHAERIASLSLVCPIGIDPALAAVASRAQVIHGDQGPIAERARAAVGRMPEVVLVTLAGYAGFVWSDVCAERGGEMVPTLLDFVRRMEGRHSAGARTLTPGAGEVAGLAYRVQGSGPPLVLLPLGLSPSQWEPLVAPLSKHCSTIVLAGPHLGMVPLLEGRGQAPGYSRMVRNLVQEIGLRPSERVVEIGCGTGVLTRWLAEHTAGANPITAVDVNRYLLQEAQALAHAAGLQSVITFQEGNGLALPLRDGGFDVTLSFTVLEEGDAGRMLAELVRITRPGCARCHNSLSMTTPRTCWCSTIRAARWACSPRARCKSGTRPWRRRARRGASCWRSRTTARSAPGPECLIASRREPSPATQSFG
jgi:SAM-dependent methyltransferase